MSGVVAHAPPLGVCRALPLQCDPEAPLLLLLLPTHTPASKRTNKPPQTALTPAVRGRRSGDPDTLRLRALRQRVVRRHSSNAHLLAAQRGEFDALLRLHGSAAPPGKAPAGNGAQAGAVALSDADGLTAESSTDGGDGGTAPVSGRTVFQAAETLRLIDHLKKNLEGESGQDDARVVALYRAALAGMGPSQNPRHSYVGLSVDPKMTGPFIGQVKQMAAFGIPVMHRLGGKAHGSNSDIQCLLSFWMRALDANGWGLCKGNTPQEQLGLKALAALCVNVSNHVVAAGITEAIAAGLSGLICRARPMLTTTIVAVGVTLCTRLVLGKGGAAAAPTLSFIELARTLLTVPGLIHHLFLKSPDVAKFYTSQKIGTRCVDALVSSAQTLRIIFNSLEGNGTLCLIGNLAQLVLADAKNIVAEARERFIALFSALLGHCRQYVTMRRSNISVSHPIFGYFSGTLSRGMIDAFPAVLKQIQLLWQPSTVGMLFAPVVACAAEAEADAAAPPTGKGKSPKGKAGKRRKPRTWFGLFQRSSSTPVTDPKQSFDIKQVCQLYALLKDTLTTFTVRLGPARALAPELHPVALHLAGRLPCLAPAPRCPNHTTPPNPSPWPAPAGATVRDPVCAVVLPRAGGRLLALPSHAWPGGQHANLSESRHQPRGGAADRNPGPGLRDGRCVDVLRPRKTACVRAAPLPSLSLSLSLSHTHTHIRACARTHMCTHTHTHMRSVLHATRAVTPGGRWGSPCRAHVPHVCRGCPQLGCSASWMTTKST